MEISYKTRGTCSRSIHITLSDDGVIESCSFEGGCPGNTQGVAALVRGMKAAEVNARGHGNPCRNGTTCPDQLARALRTAREA